ncbi:hypothetical protein HPB47_016359, partial [Ixodes persulcatus]
WHWETQYLTSCFLGHTCAEDLASAFTEATEPIKQVKILQVSMVRWLENGKVITRALQVLPNLAKFVECSTKGNKRPTCSSYSAVVNALIDQLLPAKLASMLSIAEELESFSAEFQTDKPMIPFLSTAMYDVLRLLLARILKKEILNAADTPLKLLKKQNGPVVPMYRFVHWALHRKKLKDFDRKEERLDVLWLDLCSLDHRELLSFIKIILRLSHGNAAVERGFSVNKECIVENLKVESLIAQRVVHDAVLEAGGVDKVEITDKMVRMVRNSYSVFRKKLQKKEEESREESDVQKNKKEWPLL